MRQYHADHGACNLNDAIRRRIRRRQSALRRIGDRDGRIEVRTGYRPKRQDQRHQCGACCDRIRQQRYGNVAVRQTVPHDSGADDCRQKDAGTDEFRRQPSRERFWAPHELPNWRSRSRVPARFPRPRHR